MSAVGVELDRLADHLGGELHGRSELVSSITHDSRTVAPGTVFACIPGDNVDGHDFAGAAVDAGASALLVERVLHLPHAPDLGQIVVPDSRASLGPAAAEIYDHPERDVSTIGVTGTNGKTTVTSMLGSMLGKLGKSVEVMGTLSGARTTPEASELFARLASMRSNGVRYLAMEVSSHALQLHRVAGMTFAATAFTNLSQDHLDFHPTMEQYFEAKSWLFSKDFSSIAVINADDVYGRRLLERRPDARPYSLDDVDDLQLTGPVATFSWLGRPVTLQLAGRHNVSNAICAATILDSLGFDADDVADSLGAIDPIPGRMEWVSIGQPFRIVVDYSHTPDSLRVALEACRCSAGEGGQVSVVFGCGGDRDRAKRPLMGAEASAGADRVVLTSDNPRSEDPDVIIEEILAGIPSDASFMVEPDRQSAIDAAVASASPGDVILVAGKGHETTQTIGELVVDFDDRLASLTALQRAGW